MLRTVIAFLIILFNCAALEAKDAVKIACVGDSITDGFGLANASLDAWPVLLNDMLGESYLVENCGQTGKTHQQGGRESYWDTYKFKKAKALNPDIVIIKLGTNDAKEANWKNPEKFRADLNAMIDEFAALDSKPKIYLSTCAWVRRDAISITEDRVLNGVIPIILDTAKRRGFKVLDFHNLLRDKPELYCDDIHPNEAGALAMAQFVYKSLTGKRNAPKVNRLRGKSSDFFGFRRLDAKSFFRNVSLFIPSKPKKLWVCAFNNFKGGQSDELYKLLLKGGAYVLNFDIEGGLGSPRYLDMGDRFFKYYAKLLETESKPLLFGEGLASVFALNYAAKNPDKVAGLVLVKPVELYAWAKESESNAKRFAQEWRDSKGEADIEFLKDLNLKNFEALERANLPILIVSDSAKFALPGKLKNVGSMERFDAAKISNFCLRVAGKR